MKRSLLIAFLLLFTMMGSIFAQERTITGTITSAIDGTPLPGVTVLAVGTNKGVITDLDGKYSISVPSGTTTLRFSFVGMQAEDVEIGNQSVISLALDEDTTEMEEVVVTALGIPKKEKALGYSVTKVDGDEVALSGTISPVESLQGKVAGLDITRTEGGTFGGTRITVRGNSTLGSNNQPIFVVDGVFVDNGTSGGSQWGGSDWGNDLKNLNPDDFETVVVLKGSAATALYGSRALNGAIIITTKKGKARKGLGISFSQTVNTKNVYAGPAFQNVYGEGGPPGYDDRPSGDKFAPQNGFLINSDNEPYVEGTAGWWWVPISYGHKMDGTQIRDWDGEWINYNPQPNNFVDAFDRGMYSNTNLTLDGGNDRSTFIISASNASEKGTSPNNDFRRTSLSSRVTYKLNDYISTEVGISYVNSLSQNPPTSLAQYFITGNWPRNYDTNKWKHNYKASHGGLPSNKWGDPNANVPGHNVWFGVYENHSDQLQETVRINGRVNAQILPWMEFVVEGYINNLYTTYEAMSLGTGYANEGGGYTLNHSRKEQYDAKFWLNLDKQLTSNIHGRLSLGGELWNTSNSYSNARTNGMIVPAQFTLSNSKNQAIAGAGITNRKSINSVYFFADVDWKNQLFVSVTGRNDWSSTLTYMDGSGNNSYFYPSISASWLISESFSLPEFMSFTKLRASWAHVGNDYRPYSINPGYNNKGTLNSVNGDIVMYGYNSSTVPNLNLRPEDKKSVEVGFDLRFFKNRLGLDLTYYKENTYNQILSIPVPGESGVGGQLINAGNIQNKGVEIALNVTPIQTKDFRWDIDFIYTRNRNMIIDLYEGIEQYNLYESATYGNTRIGTVAFVGGAYGVLMSDSKPAVWDSEEMGGDSGKDGMPLLQWHSSQRGAYYKRSYEKQIIGDMNPDFTGGVSTSLLWKGFNFRALFDIKIGGDISTYSGRYGTAYGLFESTLANRDAEHGGFEWTSKEGVTYDDGFIPEGVFQTGTQIDGNDVAGLSYQEAYDQGLAEPMHGAYWHWKHNTWSNGIINDAVLQENSYIGVRELYLGYTLPVQLANKLHLNFLSIGIFGRDLGFVYKTLKDNLNPFSIRSNNSGSAHEWQQAPYVRTLGFTLKLGI